MIKIQISEQPTYIPLRYNGYYKLVILLSIIKYCAHSGKASLNLIHLIFWSLRSDDNYEIILAFARQERNTLVPWSFEQGIEQVLSLGLIYEYVEKVAVGNEFKIKLTSAGENVIKQINEYGLFEEEIKMMISIGKVSMERVVMANKNWSIL